jgi:hypothetical protein
LAQGCHHSISLTAAEAMALAQRCRANFYVDRRDSRHELRHTARCVGDHGQQW